MSHLSRRQFIEDSMFATLAALAANSTSSLLAQEQKRTVGPNEKLSVAVIGCNGRGGSHLNAFGGKPDTQVTVICDVDENVGRERSDSVAKKQGLAPKWVKDMREVFDDPSVDIVTTATPNHWHSLTSIWAIQAGKDMYCEKPVSHNVSEGRRVVEAARKYKKICQTGTQCRSMPGSILAIDHIKSGKIGEVKLARGLCYKSRGSIGPKGTYDPPANVDFNLWTGPAPLKPITRKNFHYDWHWIWDFGNGDLGNQGIHQMDIARWGLGVTDIGRGVVSYGGRFSYVDAGETANTQVSIHDYGDKTLVFEVRGLKTDGLKAAKVGVIFYGTQGYVVLDSYQHGAAFDLDGKMVQEFRGGDDELHFGNFIKAVRSRKHEDLNADIEQGHLSSALCHLGNISYRLGEQITADEAKSRLSGSPEATETFERFSSHLGDNGVDLKTTKIGFGRKLTIDAANETFTGAGSEQANPMLTREYRAPFIVPAKGQV